ncbi:hypothetical protein K458DRAFT_456245 [Lentithecium fluviatile CBS 122367]|uniref:Uncharacterized protein n=1 Tax=Lentithecium fluviatile CBS 122367 TaxID=1168545 RepID=A0A6G1IVE0_9PLEO|nr:hypothetical protein K458DRAFT_456245 [Lentithecium fluviatile CBS 122367]
MMKSIYLLAALAAVSLAALAAAPTLTTRNTPHLQITVGSQKQNVGHWPDAHALHNRIRRALYDLAQVGPNVESTTIPIKKPCQWQSGRGRGGLECDSVLTVKIDDMNSEGHRLDDAMNRAVAGIVQAMVKDDKNCWNYARFGRYCNIADYIDIVIPGAKKRNVHVSFISEQHNQYWGKFDCVGTPNWGLMQEEFKDKTGIQDIGKSVNLTGYQGVETTTT